MQGVVRDGAAAGRHESYPKGKKIRGRGEQGKGWGGGEPEEGGSSRRASEPHEGIRTAGGHQNRMSEKINGVIRARMWPA